MLYLVVEKEWRSLDRKDSLLNFVSVLLEEMDSASGNLR